MKSILIAFAGAVLPGTAAIAQDDVAGIDSRRVEIGGDAKKTYILHGRKGEREPPQAGYKLLLVLPGGNGGEGFQTFVKRILAHGLPQGYVVAQVVAPRWSDSQEIVWPAGKSRVPGQKFTTEELIESVIEDAGRKARIDERSIFALGWSSSGPALYSALLREKTPLTGFYISMSVFKPETLPPLEAAKDRVLAIEHSPQDRVCPFAMAEKARDSLRKAGARVKFSIYEGGHGWRGAVYDRIRAGIEWLESGGKDEEGDKAGKEKRSS